METRGRKPVTPEKLAKNSLYRVTDAARMIGCARQTVLAMIESGLLKEEMIFNTRFVKRVK
tara:strand:- start:55 stop:237 length:183 start_codon:yes stop_codon:yes gene_type:complete